MARKASQAIKEQMKLKEKLASDHNKLEQGRAAIENIFHDISSRSIIFRNELINEFQLLDNISNHQHQFAQPPVFNTKDFADDKTRESIMRETPFQLIKFKTFKRLQKAADQTVKVDRRLTRTRNMNDIPIGAWAASVIKTKIYNYFLLSMIILNTIFVGVDAELSPHKADYWALFQFMRILELFSIAVFLMDIGIKWIDNFAQYWEDGWNLFDFVITMLSTFPVILEAFATGPGSQNLIAISTNLQSLRILRTLKLIVWFSSLKIIVLCIIQAFKSMAFIMILVFITAFVYSVIGVNMFYTYTKSDKPGLIYQFYFTDVGSGLQGLFQLLTMDRWDDMNRDFAQVADPFWSYTFVISWVFLGAFIFRNIFIGVMVTNFDKISETLKEQRKEKAKIKKFEKMRKKLNKQLLQVKENVKRSYDGLNKQTKQNQAGKDDDWKSESSSALNQVDLVLLNIQKMLRENNGSSKEWEQTVAETMAALSVAGKQNETMWPKDTLFKFLIAMENLQENMKEYQELNLLLNKALLELHDD